MSPLGQMSVFLGREKLDFFPAGLPFMLSEALFLQHPCHVQTRFSLVSIADAK